MKGKVFVIFYNGMHYKGWLKVIWQLMQLAFIPGARLQHCCLCVLAENGKDYMYHVGVGTKSSWRSARWWHRTYSPSAAV